MPQYAQEAMVIAISWPSKTISFRRLIKISSVSSLMSSSPLLSSLSPSSASSYFLSLATVPFFAPLVAFFLLKYLPPLFCRLFPRVYSSFRGVVPWVFPCSRGSLAFLTSRSISPKCRTLHNFARNSGRINALGPMASISPDCRAWGFLAYSA